MNYIRALELLKIDKNIHINIKVIKKQYHKLALIYHPDRSHKISTVGQANEPTIYSSDIKNDIMFKDINNAYQYLLNFHTDETNNTNDTDNDNKDFLFFMSNNINNIKYSVLLKQFIKFILEEKYSDTISKIIETIINNCSNISITIFDGLDKESSLSVYSFLSKHRKIFNMSNDMISQLRDIITKKYQNVSIFKINPSIDDLFDNNLYKLYIDDDLYLVPLWHNELYFENNGSEIIVICVPDISDNIVIDDENNIHINININVETLTNIILKNEIIDIYLGKKVFHINPTNLYLKSKQKVTIKNKGISKIKNDVHDIEEKSDIIVNILFI